MKSFKLRLCVAQLCEQGPEEVKDRLMKRESSLGVEGRVPRSNMSLLASHPLPFW